VPKTFSTEQTSLRHLKKLAIPLLVVGIYIWAGQSLSLDLQTLRTSWPYVLNFCTRLFPPNLSILDVALKSLLETVQMSLWGTTLGALMSIPIAIASAHNTAPPFVQWVANFLQNAIRSVPSIVLGLIFVSATGLGAPAGTLALSIYTIGYLAKFFQEAIEAIDGHSVDALITVGAKPLQIFRYGVLPQILPLMLGYTFWMFEYNIRAASVLGVVGAGGIGFQLKTYIDGFEYQKATTTILLLLMVVTAIDFLSSKLRQRLES
jgi:phosphonate transport system permease protein